MTIASSINRIAYTGDGVATGYAFPFRIFAATDLRVFLNGALQSAGYTVTGVDAPSGTVNFSTAPASGVSVVLVRQVPAVQETDFADLGPFPAEASERAHDRNTVLAQQNADGIALAIRFPEADTSPSPVLPARTVRGGGFVGFDANGDLTVVQAQPAGPGTTEAYWFGGTAGGTANAQTITVASPPAVYAAGQRFVFLAAAANTGAATLNVNGLGARSITKGNGATALASGDIPAAGAAVSVVYDTGGGGRFRLLNVPTSAPDLSPYALLAGANTFTAAQVVQGTAAAELLTVRSTDAGASAAGARLDRNSASPANNDELFDLSFGGRDNAAAARTYARLRALIRDVTAATAEGELVLSVLLAGALNDAVRIRNGVVLGGATGGFQGAGTINATGFFINGAAAKQALVYTSPNQTPVIGGAFTLNHGLGGVPTLLEGELECLTAEAGYSVGDVIGYSPYSDAENQAGGGGVAIRKTATQLLGRWGNAGGFLIVLNASTGADTVLTPANWAFRVTAVRFV